MTVDHPLVRSSYICPLCRNHKDQGLVLCWPCHRKEKAANGGCYSNTAETIIEAREYRLSRP